MNVLSLMATLGLDTKEYDEGLGNARGNAEAFGKKLTKILGGIAVGAALKKVTDQIVSLTKQAVKAYAEYEQLVGGVETLFGTGGKSLEQFAENASKSMYHMGQKGEDIKKLQQELIKAGYDVGDAGADGIYGPKTQAAFDAYAKAGGKLVQEGYNARMEAQETVLANADKAWMSAGMSANEYMDTVTGFAGSLLQSVGGDTKKAADIANMAIVDMSDNANKLGTSMESIQYAYQGLARQNFTMLDNLKLGYNGTAAEMARLINDTGVMGDTFVATEKNIKEVSFDKYIEAIHVMQQQMGIAGTTAEEAEKTIEGSFKSTRAAWMNLVTALGSGNNLKGAMKNLITSAKTLVKNVIPVIRQALSGIGELITELAPVIASELPGLIEELLPPLLTALGQLIAAVVTNLPKILSALWNGLVTALSTIWDSLVAQYPILGEIAGKLSAFFTDAWEAVKTAWNNITTFFTDLWSDLTSDPIIIAIGDTFKKFFTDAYDSITEYWDGIKTFFSTLWKLLSGDLTLGQAMDSFKNSFESAYNGITGFWDNILTFFSDLWSNLEKDPKIGTIATLLSTPFKVAKTEIETAWNTVTAFFSGIWALITGEQTLSQVLDSLKQPFVDAWNEIKGLWNGAQGAFADIWTKITTNQTLIAIVDTLKKPFVDAWDAIKGAWDVVVGFFSDIWTSITTNPTIQTILSVLSAPFTGAKEAIDSVLSAATSLRDGIGAIVAGIRDAFLAPWNEITSAINNAISAIKDFLGLSSEASSADAPKIRTGGGGSSRGGGAGRSTISTIDHATAMSDGEILRGLTPFGIDSNGTIHYGGEAGAEAVVGVNSLDSMIQNSVNNAVAKMAAMFGGGGNGRMTVQLVLDSGALLGEVDLGLNEIAQWRGGGRA